MKRALVLGAVCGLLIVVRADWAWAEDGAPVADPDAVRDLVRQEVQRVVREQVGGEEQVADAQTVTGVIERALDMVERFAVRAGEIMERIAPDAWRIMIRQQYVKGVQRIALSLGFLFIALICWLRTKNLAVDDNDGGFTFLWYRGIPVLCLIIGAIAFVICLSDALCFWINPEYYAIREILESLRPAAR
jgi:hypothetical protein